MAYFSSATAPDVLLHRIYIVLWWGGQVQVNSNVDKIPSIKSQITNKIQIPTSNDPNGFVLVIDYCNL